MTTKLYCYVDETGQDTEGELYLVAIVLKEINELEALKKNLESIEHETGKKQSKWKKTSKDIKKKYLDKLVQIKKLKHAIFYSTYQASKEYSKLTSLSIAKAVLAKGSEDYVVTIVIDGLNDKERDVVRAELKKLRIKYRKIRGMKDEQSVFLRLSDSIAGFLRDVYEKEAYSKQYVSQFKKLGLITET